MLENSLDKETPDESRSDALVQDRPPSVNPAFELTDEGNARRIVHYYGHEIRYCQDMGVWFYWTKMRWTQYICEHCLVERTTGGVSDHIIEEAKNLSNDEDREKYRQWAIMSQEKERVEVMMELAKSQPELVVQSWQLDSDPNLLNVCNGTLDLLTRELHDYDPADLITRMADVEYNSEADCPLWKDFVELITNSNEHEIKYVHSLVRECLTGLPGAKITYFEGPGGSGKKTFLETIGALLGEYAYYAPRGMLNVRKHKCLRSELGHLRGARLVITKELKKDKSLDDELMKNLPTRKKIVARSLSGKSFRYTPTHKLWAYGKYEPIIKDDDSLVFRDAALVFFPRVLPREAEAIFTYKHLRREWSGILNWAIRDLQRSDIMSV